MLVGSFASAFYGASRSTRDVDIVINATSNQLRTLVTALQSDGYYAELDAALQAQRDESLFNVIDNDTGWKIDLIPRKSRPFSREEFERRQRVDFVHLSLFVASAEDVVVSKLEWAKLAQSQRQIEDAARILRAQGPSIDGGYLKRWISDLQLEAQWQDACRIGGIGPQI